MTHERLRACWLVLVLSCAVSGAAHADGTCTTASLRKRTLPLAALRELAARTDESSFKGDPCDLWKSRLGVPATWTPVPVAARSERNWILVFSPGVLRCTESGCSVPAVRGISMQVLNAEPRLNVAEVRLTPNRVSPLVSHESIRHFEPSCQGLAPPAIAASDEVPVARDPMELSAHPGPGCERPDARSWGILDACAPKVAFKAADDPSRVRVAVLDSGLDCLHPALQDQIVGTGDPIPSHRRCARSAGINYVFESKPADNCDEIFPLTCGAHGTGVAGVIGSRDQGVEGIDPNAKMRSMRILHPGSSLDIVSPVKLASAILDSKPDQVLNISANWYQDYPWIAEAIDRLTGDGRHLIVSSARQAGQGTPSPPAYPAAYTLCNRAVVGVTSIVPEGTGKPEYVWGSDAVADQPAYFVAPGGHILTTSSNGGSGPAHDIQNGSSFAAPHVAAAASLLWSTDEYQACSAIGIHAALFHSSRMANVASHWRRRLHLGCLFGQRDLGMCDTARDLLKDVKAAFCTAPAPPPTLPVPTSRR